LKVVRDWIAKIEILGLLMRKLSRKRLLKVSFYFCINN
jgi:hypothetical protein